MFEGMSYAFTAREIRFLQPQTSNKKLDPYLDKCLNKNICH